MPWTPQSKLKTTYSQTPVGDHFRQLRLTREVVKENQARATKAYEAAFNKKAKERRFEEGDKVLVHYPPPPGINPKLFKPWRGPFEVVRRGDFHTVELLNPETKKNMTIHLARVKLFNELEQENTQGPQARRPPHERGRAQDPPPALPSPVECADEAEEQNKDSSNVSESSLLYTSTYDTIIENEVTMQQSTQASSPQANLDRRSSVITQAQQEPESPQSLSSTLTPPAASTPIKPAAHCEVGPRVVPIPFPDQAAHNRPTTRHNGARHGVWDRNHQFHRN